MLQRIAELRRPDHDQAWSELLARSAVIVPFVQVEEVLVNLGEPRETSLEVVETMCRDLWKLRNTWIADETDWAFAELVDGKKSRAFLPVDSRFLDRLEHIRPDRPDYQAFLKMREAEEHRIIAERVITQREAAEWRKAQGFPGEQAIIEDDRIFFIVPSEKEFFRRFVTPGFLARDKDPQLWLEMLDKSLGQSMRARYPAEAARIGQALAGLSTERLKACPATFNIIVSKLYYFWAPLVRIGTHPNNARRLLRRGERQQRGNIHDERYVAAAMLCNSLLTCDEDMENAANCLVRCGLWTGKVVNVAAKNGRSILQNLAALPLPS